ncbi:MAG TPA: hypothetical protein VMI52_06265 [Acetobacteraceae bacterium]|nr:hypothetical protein [Acetobacteraceae bacterium]
MGDADVRVPSLVVLANGVLLPGVIEAEVGRNNHYAADRFCVRAALSPSDAAIWNQAGLELELRFGLDGAMASLVTGLVDHVRADALRGEVTFEGRDLSAGLIEARTREAFANRTASEVAMLLAARHGLLPMVTPTVTPVGRYYQSEHERVTLDQFARATTEWDLLVFLAQREGFDVWVEGRALFFAPPGDAVGMVLSPAQCVSLRLERALTIAGDIEVTVKSWNSARQAAFQTSVRRRGAGGGGRVQSYVFVRPNLTPDEAQVFARRALEDLSRHERVVEAVLPGELGLSPRSRVTLAGTGTDFDRDYDVAEIERRISAREGFTERLRLRSVAAEAVEAAYG